MSATIAHTGTHRVLVPEEDFALLWDSAKSHIEICGIGRAELGDYVQLVEAGVCRGCKRPVVPPGTNCRYHGGGQRDYSSGRNLWRQVVGMRGDKALTIPATPAEA